VNKVDRPHTSPSDPESQTHQAYAEIERRIVSLELAPGQLVSENGLSDALGLGRTPVREALKELSREGLVVILPKRGIVVADIDVARQLRLLELRRAVEGFVAEAAARRATPEERATFARLAKAMEAAEAAEDGEGFLQLDAEFNRLILVTARNEYATAAMKLTQGLSRRFWFAHYRQADNLRETIRLHAQIARAIADRDPVRAREGLEQLLDNVEAFTRATLDPDRMA
jgi:DNA-binding GntR family transcriptional regulator